MKNSKSKCKDLDLIAAIINRRGKQYILHCPHSPNRQPINRHSKILPRLPPSILTSTHSDIHITPVYIDAYICKV